MLQNILNDLKPSSAQLVAVSKTKPNEKILTIYHQGVKTFGENRVPELVQKMEELPDDINWHFIGHLQTKKVKYIAPFVQLIHSVDSIRLLKEIDKQAKRNNRIIDVLLQFKIADEESKYGLSSSMADELLQSDQYATLENARVVGVMGMATYTDDKDQVRNEFKNLKEYFDHFQKEYFTDQPHFKEISMGMSGDYKIAIEEGSTMVRIGSLIFS